MAIKDYTLSEIKELVLNNINSIEGLKTLFSPSDADEAYNSAVRDCGFELPDFSEDESTKRIKYQWIINRMDRWFLSVLWTRYIFRFKSGDMEAQQIVSNLKARIEMMDKEFNEAKASIESAHIFMSYDNIFNTQMVMPTGFIEDRLGEETQDEINNRLSS